MPHRIFLDEGKCSPGEMLLADGLTIQQHERGGMRLSQRTLLSVAERLTRIETPSLAVIKPRE